MSGVEHIADAASAMTGRTAGRIGRTPTAVAMYDQLFADYMMLHDHFGRGGDDVMRRLRSIRDRQVRAAPN